MLRRTIGANVPHLLRGRARELFPRTTFGIIVFIYINFSLRGRRVRGYITLLLDLPTMSKLKSLLDEFIARATG